VLFRSPAFSVRDEGFFLDMTRLLFSYRRKKIKTIIRNLVTDSDDLPFLDNRVEDLTPEQIGSLSDRLLEKRTSGRRQ
jgi:16S rRNA A1518/A1519 N6-dimethyltransferase RsmA/KsgA/DIM1 with predicted DNA glycosylase/AP lyase activity